MRPSIARANEQLDPRQPLANTPPPQSTTPGLHPISSHHMAPPERTSDCSSLFILYAIQHRTVLIIFTLFLQTIIISQILSIEGDGVTG